MLDNSQLNIFQRQQTRYATKKELLETVFSIGSAPRTYSEHEGHNLLYWTWTDRGSVYIVYTFINMFNM
jgi:hypothetical protein